MIKIVCLATLAIVSTVHCDYLHQFPHQFPAPPNIISSRTLSGYSIGGGPTHGAFSTIHHSQSTSSHRHSSPHSHNRYVEHTRYEGHIDQNQHANGYNHQQRTEVRNHENHHEPSVEYRSRNEHVSDYRAMSSGSGSARHGEGYERQHERQHERQREVVVERQSGHTQGHSHHDGTAHQTENHRQTNTDHYYRYEH